MKNQTWLLVANGSQATIYQYLADGSVLEEIGGTGNGTRRFKDEDLVTDRPGVKSGGGSNMHGQSALAASISPTDKAKQDFARSIVTELEEARCKNKFSFIDLVVTPEMLGLIRDNMNTNLLEMINKSVSKDGTNKTNEELLKLTGH